jgi:hypothetical protein
VNARVALVTAQRDRVVASYTVLAATGGLSAQVLGLKVQLYDPSSTISSCAIPGAACARRMGADFMPLETFSGALLSYITVLAHFSIV